MSNAKSTDFAKKLRDFRTKAGLTQEAMGQKLGVGADYISMLERGEKNPGETLVRLLDIYRESPLYTKEADGDSSRVEEAPNVFLVSPSAKTREIPIYTFVQAGLATDYQGLPTAWGDTIAYDGKNKNAFALRVAGDSMMPNFPPGTIITVEPGPPPHSGNLVVAKIEDEGVTFKLYHASGDFKTATLTSYNPLYPPRVVEREKFHWLYRVTAATQLF